MPQPGFVAHCLELLAPAGAPRARRMFGGHGLYVDELFVGLVIEERLYLKATADSAPRFEAEGGEPFRYHRDGREMSLGFWTPPPEAMESPDLMRPWVRLALQAALHARADKPVPPKKRADKPVPLKKRADKPAPRRPPAPAKGRSRRVG